MVHHHTSVNLVAWLTETRSKLRSPIITYWGDEIGWRTLNSDGDLLKVHYSSLVESHAVSSCCLSGDLTSNKKYYRYVHSYKWPSFLRYGSHPSVLVDSAWQFPIPKENDETDAAVVGSPRRWAKRSPLTQADPRWEPLSWAPGVWGGNEGPNNLWTDTLPPPRDRNLVHVRLNNDKKIAMRDEPFVFEFEMVI